MISKKFGSSECYVYITLPGQVKPVTAGKFRIQQTVGGFPKGDFVYGKSYLANPNALEIDPVELRLKDEDFETVRLKGVFGAIRDASPDFWGRRIIEKYSGKSELGEIDYLLYSAGDRAGALSFGLNSVPPPPNYKFNKTLDLKKLQATADKIVAEEEKSQDIPEDERIQISDLILLGTSMGGARPKAVVEDEQGLWVAKFNRYDDRWNSARVEHAMLLLARQCGITTVESQITRISQRDVLFVKRFDREKTDGGYFRRRMISGLTLLQADDRPTARGRWSYISLVEELRRASSEPKSDAQELFKRMCFNALISNIDDHPRNHALISFEKNWRLSPAYDLNPATPISMEHRDLAMTVGDQGRFANAKNLLSQAQRFLLTPEAAKKIVDDMTVYIQENWNRVARGAGVTEKDCENISTAFVYPGFKVEGN